MKEKEKTNKTQPEQPKTKKQLAIAILLLIGNFIKVIDMFIGSNRKENDIL